MPERSASWFCVQPFNSRSILIVSPVVNSACAFAGRNSVSLLFIILLVFMRRDFNNINRQNVPLDGIDHAVLQAQPGRTLTVTFTFQEFIVESGKLLQSFRT